MHHTGGTIAETSGEMICARTASDQDIMQENAQTWVSATVVNFLGTLLLNALHAKSLCWNCKEPGHMASECSNKPVCHNCGKAGHAARDCSAPPLPPGKLRLCNNCYKQGHVAADCTNEKACNNCWKTGHIARDCSNEPVCNLCNIAGHVARQCPKADMLGERAGDFRGGGFRDIVCRTCNQVGHMSRDCMGVGAFMICHNFGGRGHSAYECPSGRFFDRIPRRF